MKHNLGALPKRISCNIFVKLSLSLVLSSLEHLLLSRAWQMFDNARRWRRATELMAIASSTNNINLPICSCPTEVERVNYYYSSWKPALSRCTKDTATRQTLRQKRRRTGQTMHSTNKICDEIPSSFSDWLGTSYEMGLNKRMASTRFLSSSR